MDEGKKGAHEEEMKLKAEDRKEKTVKGYNEGRKDREVREKGRKERKGDEL